MSGDQHETNGPPGGDRVFITTHWSLVLAAGAKDGSGSLSALETLCRSYWLPLYLYVRRRGHSAEDAQDLTQDFFRHVLASAMLAKVGRNKGRFRSYLLASLNHFLANAHDCRQARKRGGGRPVVSLDETVAGIGSSTNPRRKRRRTSFSTGNGPPRCWSGRWTGSRGK